MLIDPAAWLTAFDLCGALARLGTLTISAEVKRGATSGRPRLSGPEGPCGRFPPQGRGLAVRLHRPESSLGLEKVWISLKEKDPVHSIVNPSLLESYGSLFKYI